MTAVGEFLGVNPTWAGDVGEVRFHPKMTENVRERLLRLRNFGQACVSQGERFISEWPKLA